MHHHELLQTLRCRFNCLRRAEHFLLDEVADAPIGFVTNFVLRDGMIDLTGRQVVLFYYTDYVIY